MSLLSSSATVFRPQVRRLAPPVDGPATGTVAGAGHGKGC
ncbi:hypothetical protein Ga0080574_TMP3297 [Salipiger abyssi]|uniref:Uncharacterized protein n=1 Tax=Salipiger abyssi TaxID=1250539 RepID=A0A1P8UW67_9RHOB|nr:hypothetical protein Ga0080574_TMP3297 [Salipiger abyssi]